MKKLFLLIICCFLLTSCSLVTMERQLYPICMSVDAAPDGRFHLALQAPRSSAAGGASYDIISATGDTLQDALRLLSASTPYPLNFSQLRLCLIGYHLAASTPLRPLLRALMELPSMRPMACVSVAMGTGLEVMQNQQPDFGNRLSTHLNLLFDRLSRDHLLPESTLAYCVRELSDGRCDLLIALCAVNARLVPEEEKAREPSSTGSGESGAPAFAPGEARGGELLPEDVIAGMISHTSPNPVEYLGSAAVSEGRVSGVLTADETQLALRLLAQAELHAARRGDTLELRILLKKDSQLAALQDRITALMAKLQSLHSDPLRFGSRCAMSFATNAEWEQYDFRSRYSAAPVVIRTQDR